MNSFKNFFVVFCLVLLAILLYERVQKIRSGEVTIQGTSAPVHEVQSVNEVVIPVVVTVVAPTESVSVPVVVPVNPVIPVEHPRTGITPGTTGSHDTGRQDTRTP